MRWVFCALVVLALPTAAFAADLGSDWGDLRGPEPVGPANFTNWTGVYFGGDYSYGNGSAAFSNATAPLVAQSLTELELEAVAAPSEWPVLGSGTTRTSGFGGFVGYNTQWQDLILGLEGDYTHAPFTVIAPQAPILDRVVTVGSDQYSVNLTAAGTLTVNDYGSVRARAGWVLGNFLPYGFAGLALGNANYAVNTLIYGQQNSSQVDPSLPCDAFLSTCVDYAFSNSSGRNGVLLYGLALGGGLDVALTRNIFLRGEYEYIRFAPVSNISATIATVRGGVGVKF
ncbi:MAG TPA: outer membrane beta-barrel protein [Xanthobacteraceae bacterium]|jgi:opacity protein-like surface antigen|nr:outer membrane beta-barrel protein [Xanthobacteraceae bacterium]